MDSLIPTTIDAIYYATRRDKAILLANRAVDPAIKAIHQRMAERYENLARNGK